MTPDQVIKPIVILFVVLVVFLAIRKSGRRQTG
jgi:hypothetical protein